jgi:hypothetical protein
MFPSLFHSHRWSETLGLHDGTKLVMNMCNEMLNPVPGRRDARRQDLTPELLPVNRFAQSGHRARGPWLLA